MRHNLVNKNDVYIKSKKLDTCAVMILNSTFCYLHLRFTFSFFQTKSEIKVLLFGFIFNLLHAKLCLFYLVLFLLHRIDNFSCATGG